MPLIIDNPISRKKFLKTSLKYAGALSSLGLVYTYSEASEKNKDFHMALLADTHVKAYKNEQYRGFFPYKNLQIVIEEVRKAAPEIILINGDVARLDGQLGDYVAVEEILSPLSDYPVVMTLGNHDDRDNFYNVFGEENEGKQSIANKHVLVFEKPDFRMILLDSLMFVNKTPGLLGREQRDWLSSYLKDSDDRPVFVFFHHTPYDSDSDLLDSDRLFYILLPYKNVKAVFYGHSHVYHISERDHIKLINQPAVGYNFIDSQPIGWLDVRINPKKGIFTLHAIGGNTDNDGKVTEVIWN